MIKCDGYGKLLKLSFFGLLTSFFTIFVSSSVNAQSSPIDLYVYNNGSYSGSYADSNINMAVYSKALLSSQRLGLTRRSLAFVSVDNNRAYMFRNEGLPYFYYYESSDHVNFQGYASKYRICDELGNGVTSMSNCSTEFINDSFVETVKPLFNSITSSDVYGTNFGRNTNYGRYYFINVCFSSSEYHKSICFSTIDGLSGSLGIVENAGLGDIPSYFFGDPPGWSTAGEVGGNGGNISGGSEQVVVSPITGDVMTYTCTKSRALSWYRRNGYNENMCYSSYGNNTDIFSGAGSVSDFSYTGTYIRSVWQDTSTYRREGQLGSSMDYLTWFKYWRNTYEIYQSRSDSLNNPFYGVPVSVFMLFGNITQYGRPYESDSILDFCSLLTYSDLSTPYSGFYSSQICSQSALDILADMYGIHASGGQLVAGSSWVGITNRVPISGDVLFSGGEMQDSLSFQNNIFNLLKSVFRYPEENGNRFLPEFIVIGFIGIVFFRLIRKRY